MIIIVVATLPGCAMHFHFSFFSLCTILVLVQPVARAEPSPVETPGFAPKLTIYLAKGAANSCGPGCDRWIAVEGRVDDGAAHRVRQFLRRVKTPAPPFYFNSPGGDVRQGLAIGRMLRARQATARVGRTIVAACNDDPQIDDACEAIKTSDKEIEATVVTSKAMCNSTCSYLFLGATTREVAPDATVGIHNPELIMHFTGHPSPALRAAAISISRNRIDGETASYVAAMGISHDLMALVHATPFEKPHALTRQELYRFGIDKRDLAETAWTFDLNSRPRVRKFIVMKKGDDTFRTEGWEFLCGGKDRVRLAIVRETERSVKDIGIGIENDGGEAVPVTGIARRAGQYWGWNAMIKSADMSNLLDTGHLRTAEIATFDDGHQEKGHFEIDMSSLDHVWAKFSLACATKVTITTPAPAWPQGGAAAPILTSPKATP